VKNKMCPAFTQEYQDFLDYLMSEYEEVDEEEE
jgi:hypothetical protein